MTGVATEHRVKHVDDNYKWVALANTTASVFMSQLDGSIVLIAMPAIFRGIGLDPLAPSNIGYLLWMVMGYRLVQSVLVVAAGRLGDIYGRVKLYNVGFAIFTVASIVLSVDPYRGADGALWLIAWRVPQAAGGAILMANSIAILTDAFPASQRGFALGTNQIAGLAGMFIGLAAGGILAAIDWRLIFWVNVPVGIYGTAWAYWRLRDVAERSGGTIDWWGNITFALGLSAVLIASTYGIQPLDGSTTGWTNPWVLAGLVGGIALLIAFGFIERGVSEPMVQLGLFRIRAFAAGNVANFSASLARGGLQFMVVIWLQGIWLPLHGYTFSRTPLYAGLYMLPLAFGFMIAGPTAGTLSDRWGSRGIATAGALTLALSFAGLMLLPVNFSFMAFGSLLLLGGVGTGMFVSPNASWIMGSVPASQRGVASGTRSTFLNSATAVSIAVVFTTLVAGVAGSLRPTLYRGLTRAGLAHPLAHRLAGLPPASSLFAAVLGVNPLEHLLREYHALGLLTASARATLTSRTYFPHLISAPFHTGLVVALSTSIVLSLIAAGASYVRLGSARAVSR
ncbi:MFS transporter [Conexibacter sp. S30A1]|uniref:MFS transporter n=1 Tax=Conexibacter sp. S30A1 TaxID=2937800 RepID=UPI003530C1D9